MVILFALGITDVMSGQNDYMHLCK